MRMRSLEDRREAPVDQALHGPRARSRAHRFRMLWGRGRFASAPPTPQVGELAGYLGDLQEWSHRAWMAAGIRRPWLPEAVRREVGAAWGLADGSGPPRDGDGSRSEGDGRNGGHAPDPADRLRDRIAAFWAEVLPWMAWNPETEPLPDPPPEPRLTEAIVARLERDIRRLGRPVVGAERSAALLHGVQRLRFLTALRGGGGVVSAR
jgi:hypothetical protein